VKGSSDDTQRIACSEKPTICSNIGAAEAIDAGVFGQRIYTRIFKTSMWLKTCE
jgi:hypothetical protein